MKLSLIYYPNASKKNRKTGKTPLYARIFLRGQKAEARLNAMIPEADLFKWDARTMRFTERSHFANGLLNNIDNKFQQFVSLNSTHLNRYSAKSVRDLIMGFDQPSNQPLLAYLDNYYEKSVVHNVERSAGTARNYRKAINHIKAFLAAKKLHHFLLSDVDNKFVSEFRDYLVNSLPGSNRKGMTEVSASCILKKFRTIFDRALNDNLIDKNAFKSVKLKNRSPQRQRLSINDILQLHRLDLADFPVQALYRDIFLFSVFTGLAYQDAMNLKRSDLKKRHDGEVRLAISRTKTDVFTESFLVSFAQSITTRYENSSESNILGNVLPKRSNKELNVQLKILALMAGISIKLTSHIARHTFRQLLAESGVEDTGVIKRMMGQSRRGDVDEVYYSVTESRLIQAKNKFERFLQNYLKNDNRVDNAATGTGIPGRN